jgi:coproporphyrinogen III oxidase-like Fe-S oxidoreductase
MYNWMYPLQSHSPWRSTGGAFAHSVFGLGAGSSAGTRALYFHIPFCETVCSFCPFVRGPFSESPEVDQYLEAMLRELDIKARCEAVASVPIGAIFVGGGTPSLLSPRQIRRFGNAIRGHFDLSELREFSFECEAKSATPERIEAMREIGVTHGRLGVQTFNPDYRNLFTLTATLDQVRSSLGMLRQALPFVSFDLLYGMDGQALEGLLADLAAAVETGISNIDVYPIDNVVTQRRLHRAFARRGWDPLSAPERFEMKLLVREFMEASGFLPHNGHGFVRARGQTLDRDQVVTDAYCFHYHDHIYGYADHDLIGFGAGAVSLVGGCSVTNCESRSRYTKSLLEDGDWELRISPQHPRAQHSRPLIMRLPYHGLAVKDRIRWDRVHPQTIEKIGEAIREGLILDRGDRLTLTRMGWYWYAELMYFLMPTAEQAVLDGFIAEKAAEPDRRIGDLSLAEAG